MVFLPLQADPDGLSRCGKHCHLLGIWRLSADPASQTEAHFPSNLCVRKLGHQSRGAQHPRAVTAFPSGPREELLNRSENRDNQFDLVLNL